MSVPTPQLGVRYIREDGKLTPEGMRLLLRMAEAIRALETTATDHETRITILEP